MGKQPVYSHLVCNYQLMICYREGSVPIVFINCDYTKSDTKLCTVLVSARIFAVVMWKV